MLILNADQVRARAPMPHLIESLREAFRSEYVVPLRQVSKLPGGEGERLLLQMPAFNLDGSGAVKLTTYFPDNPAKDLPTIQSSIVVFSPQGTPIALLDGAVVTKLRTGAASALASTYLSRAESSHLVIIGTGALAPYMAMAHCAARPIRLVSVCGRGAERAAATAAEIRASVDKSIEVRVCESPEEAVRTADIVSCATSSSTPVVLGRWLKPGSFVDLVGSFSPDKREADDDAVSRSRIFVDTLEGVLSEAGDIIDPLKRGVIARGRIEGELADLTRGKIEGRRNDTEIILFKSVGTAIEDLAAAQLIVGNDA